MKKNNMTMKKNNITMKNDMKMRKRDIFDNEKRNSKKKRMLVIANMFFHLERFFQSFSSCEYFFNISHFENVLSILFTLMLLFQHFF